MHKWPNSFLAAFLRPILIQTYLCYIVNILLDHFSAQWTILLFFCDGCRKHRERFIVVVPLRDAMKNPFWVIRSSPSASFICILYLHHHFLSSIPPYPSYPFPYHCFSLSRSVGRSVSVLGRASCDSYGNKSSLSHPIPILGQARYGNSVFICWERNS